MTLTRLLYGEAAFTKLAAEWDKLAARGMTDTPFQHLAYQRAWWRHLGPEAATLYTIIACNDAGHVGAIASFYLLDGVLFFNGCVEETDYLDLIAPAGKAETAWTAVFDHLCSDEFPQWQAMDLCNVPEASPTRRVLPQLAQARGFSFGESVHEVCPVIQLPATFDDYLDGIDSKQRREIRRKLRRADGVGVNIHTVGPDDDLAQAVDDFLALLQQSTYEKQDWLNESRRAIFHETAQAAQDVGMLQLMFAEVNGRKGAGLFNFDYNGRIWVYNSGLDPAAFRKLSLGWVLTAKAIETAIENGRSTFDFLRGDEAYKYRFGAEDTQIYRLQINRD